MSPAVHGRATQRLRGECSFMHVCAETGAWLFRAIFGDTLLQHLCVRLQEPQPPAPVERWQAWCWRSQPLAAVTASSWHNVGCRCCTLSTALADGRQAAFMQAQSSTVLLGCVCICVCCRVCCCTGPQVQARRCWRVQLRTTRTARSSV